MAMAAQPNHAAVVDGENMIEWLASMPPDVGASMARRLSVAEDLGQKDIVRYLHKLIRAWAAANGDRVKMIYDIAKNEEVVQTAAELVAPRRGV